MTPFYVNVLRKAWRDAQAIVDWLSTRSPAGAMRWEAAFRTALKKLAENPHGCAEAPEQVRPPVKIRHILFKTPKGKQYRAVFVIEGALHIKSRRIEIWRIWTRLGSCLFIPP
jgi:plasmid stabilization system protein ParE